MCTKPIYEIKKITQSIFRAENGSENLKNSTNTENISPNSFFANEATLTKHVESVPFSPFGPPRNQPFGGDVVVGQIWYLAFTENKTESIGCNVVDEEIQENNARRVKRVI